jgi:hypothetical protein
MNKTVYIKKTGDSTSYFSDKEMTCYHREDGPAHETDGGYKSYWKDGVRHREDGPAIIYTIGPPKFFLEGFELRESDYYYEINKQHIRGLKIEKLDDADDVVINDEKLFHIIREGDGYRLLPKYDASGNTLIDYNDKWEEI